MGNAFVFEIFLTHKCGLHMLRYAWIVDNVLLGFLTFKGLSDMSSKW